MIDRTALTRSRVAVLALIAAATLYKVLNVVALGGSSLMFVGLPAVLAILVTFSPTSKTATGTVMKVMTLMLLLSAILLIEGAVCVLIASPLFYGIGLVVGVTVDATRKKRGTVARVSIVVPLALLSIQGVVPGTSGPREVTGSAGRVVSMAPDEVERALARPARFDRELPAFFKYGRFPRPLSCRLEGGNVVVDFEGLEPSHHKLTVGTSHAHHSQLVLRVAESRPGRLVFLPVSDTTMMSHWAALESSAVEWRAVPGGTNVRWTLRLHRKLDPVWYFGPMQAYAADRAAGYLIDAIFR